MQSSPRFADLGVTLALATDLGVGRPLGAALQRCLTALEKADSDSSDARHHIYHGALLSDLGCTSVATERARRSGADFGPAAGRRAKSWIRAQAEVSARLSARLGLELTRSELPGVPEGTDKAVAAADVNSVPEPDLEALRLEVLNADPFPDRRVGDLQAALEVLADFADLKSPFLLGHSRRVARLASAAAEAAGVPEETELLRYAGLAHDVGRVGISAWVWNKAETLEAAEMEAVRLHPAYTERVLEGSDSLRGVAALASAHHECIDGKGYHRGTSGDRLSPAARLLAAADDFSALTEARPHRPAMDREQAERVLHHFVDSGCLDGDAVRAVLATVEGGLTLYSSRTDPEASLVRMAARGLTPAQIAKQLDSTRANTKAELNAIRETMGVTSQGALALAALEQGILP